MSSDERQELVDTESTDADTPAQTLREAVEAFLAPRLPDDWKYVAYMDGPEVPTVPTLTYKHFDIRPGASFGLLENDITLSLVSPLADDVRAENAIDEQVLTVCHALRGWSTLTFTSARKIRDAASKRLGWDINITAITARKEV